MFTWTWSEAYYLSEWAIRLVMLFYVPNKRSPAAARTWLLLIFLLPWPGLALYGIIGRIQPVITVHIGNRTYCSFLYYHVYSGQSFVVLIGYLSTDGLLVEFNPFY